MISRRDLLAMIGGSAFGGMSTAKDVSAAVSQTPPAEGARPATHDLFEEYERRFAEARLRVPRLDPSIDADRAAIIGVAKDCLGIRDEWAPAIRAETVREVTFDGGRIAMMRATSWPGVTATALLYMPAGATDQTFPLVLLCCGHGKGGKLADGYQRMARHLTRLGAMVLCPDNLGQGERIAMGHNDCVKPFACGTSVQGLIVMETLAWLAWARAQPRVDPKRMAAIGNSGGGTLTVFLAALASDLAVLSSSGYPSTFDFIARKEKKHCHCNILPGVVGRLEMWHLLGAFAPRPLFIFQGDGDPLFPPDLFFQVARKVKHVYRARGAEEALEARVVNGGHSWDEGRNIAVGRFLARHLRLPGDVAPPASGELLLDEKDRCVDPWPADALNTDRLAEQLTGRSAEDGIQLWDVFPPAIPDSVHLEDIAPRGSTRQILAQFEAFLGRTKARQ